MKQRIIISVLCLWTGLALARTASEPVPEDPSPAPTAAEPATTEPIKDKIVVVKLEGTITEAPPSIDLGLPNLQMNIFWDQLRLIRMLKNDDTVKALVLLINDPNLGLAQCQQLAMELDQLRAAGKKVYVHSDTIETQLYVLALPATRIAMTPGSELSMNGMSATILYYKGLMDKLGIEALAFHQGKFKLFAEPYTTTRPSKYMDEQINDLLDNVYGQITGAIAKYRKMTTDKARDILDEGPFLAEQAQVHGLIDRVAHRAELLEQVQKEVPGTLVTDYKQTAPPQIKSGLGGILQLFSMLGSKSPETAAEKIAVVYVAGIIIEGESEEFFDSAQTAGTETMRKAFAQIRKDKAVKGVVVRIDSPGGSSAASEIIWGLVHETAKTKPVIASMGAEAGSGGYYIASAGSVIYASPATLTGSIGVVVGKPVVQELLKKIHLHPYTYTRGKNAGLYDPFTGLSPSQRRNVEQQMDLTFRQFKDRVMEGRKGKIKDIDALATGRVYTGEQALTLGLVDKIGTLADAVAAVADKAGIKSYKVIHLPKPKTLPELLLEGLGYKMDSEDVLSAGEDLRALVGRLTLPGPMTWAGLDHRLLRRTLLLARIMRKGGVLAIAPYEIRLK